MLKFYDVDPGYAKYLQQYDSRVPNIMYAGNNKFVCGIVLTIGGHQYFAPISSNQAKQQTSLLIRDVGNGQVLSSIKFCFMFPAPDAVVRVKNFKRIREVDPMYADLLEKEFVFCRKNEALIREKAAKIYKIGCDPKHKLHRNCCDFRLLERKQDEWMQGNMEKRKEN